MARGALVVDTRTDAQRQVQGSLPGALVIDRTVLEWRLDPTSAFRIPEAVDHDIEVVVVCSEGYSSSLAAVSLQQLGLHRATDLEGGGFLAWRATGLLSSPDGRDATGYLKRSPGSRGDPSSAVEPLWIRGSTLSSSGSWRCMPTIRQGCRHPTLLLVYPDLVNRSYVQGSSNPVPRRCCWWRCPATCETSSR